MILFSHPKPFRPDTTPVQTAAFRSWKKAFPGARILLFGKEDGTEQVSADLGLEYAGPVQAESQSGAALVSDMFQKVASLRDPLCLFMNSDIVLGQDAGKAVSLMDSIPGPWLATGRRHCLPPFRPEMLEGNRSLERLWSEHPRWGSKTALDYFLFKGLDFSVMPEFVIGHCAWDNWMIWHTRNLRIGVYDLSHKFPAFHFDHGYSYSRGNSSQTDPAGFLQDRNLTLLGNEGKRFHLGHATHEAAGNGWRARKGSSVWQREFELYRLRNPGKEKVIRFVRHVFHPLIRIWERSTNRAEDWDEKTNSTPLQDPAPLKIFRAKTNRKIRNLSLRIGLRLPGPRQTIPGIPPGVRTIREAFFEEIREPQSCVPRVHPHMAAKLQKHQATWIAQIVGLEVYGPTIAVVDSEGSLLEDVSVEWGRKPSHHWSFRRLNLPKPMILRGRSLILASTGGETYFHWMTDVLPRVQMAREAGFDPSSFDHVLINNVTRPYQRETLEALGIDLGLCRSFGRKASAYHCDDAVLPSLPGLPGNIPPTTVSFLRGLFPPKGSAGKKKLYIGRDGSSKREVVEQADIRNYLQGLGFQLLDCARLPVQEQARHLSEAEEVVVAHGAAATNLAFCRPGTKVIELFGPGYVNPCYRDLCAQAELIYSAVIGNGSDWKIETNLNAPDSAITASLGLLKKCLSVSPRIG